MPSGPDPPPPRDRPTKAGVKQISIGVGDLYMRSKLSGFRALRRLSISPSRPIAEATPASADRGGAAASFDDGRKAALAAARQQNLAAAWSAANEAGADRGGPMAGTPAPSGTAAHGGRALGGDSRTRIGPSSRAHPIRQQLAAALVEFRQSTIASSAGPGGYGEGYGAPAAVGRRARQSRGPAASPSTSNATATLMYAPGNPLEPRRTTRSRCSRWMHNNRAYHQEVMHLQAYGKPSQSRRRGGPRSGYRAGERPFIDYAKLAQRHGRLWRGARSTDPKEELGPALKRAVAVVKTRRAGARRSRDPSRDEPDRARAARAAANCTAGWEAVPANRCPMDEAPAGTAASGQRNLRRRRAAISCHGYVGQGSRSSGPRLGPEPMLPWAAFSTQGPQSPTAKMPPYGTKILPDQGAGGYLCLSLRFAAPARRMARSLPLLKLSRGRPYARLREDRARRRRWAYPARSLLASVTLEAKPRSMKQFRQHLSFPPAATGLELVRLENRAPARNRRGDLRRLDPRRRRFFCPQGSDC